MMVLVVVCSPLLLDERFPSPVTCVFHSILDGWGSFSFEYSGGTTDWARDWLTEGALLRTYIHYRVEHRNGIINLVSSDLGGEKRPQSRKMNIMLLLCFLCLLPLSLPRYETAPNGVCVVVALLYEAWRIRHYSCHAESRVVSILWPFKIIWLDRFFTCTFFSSISRYQNIFCIWEKVWYGTCACGCEF